MTAMRIGFDIRPFLKEETGVGVYFKNLLFSLSAMDRDNEYCLFTSSLKDRFPREKIPPFNKLQFRDFPFPVKSVNFLWYNLGWPPLDLFFGSRLDLTHSPTPLPLPGRGKKIVTVYDLFFVEKPRVADREARTKFRRKIGRALLKADGVITISHFTRQQLLEKYPVDPARIKVVHLGLSRAFQTGLSREARKKILARFHLPRSFLLFVGALERRKNVRTLLEAFAAVRQKHSDLHLILAGRSGEDSQAIMRKIQQLTINPWVHLLGYCTEPELRALYDAARTLVIPSLLEGFGLPLIEALACGLPVAASRNSALEEIGGDAAVYFDPTDADEMARTILSLLEDEDLRTSLSAKGRARSTAFRWKKTAEETLDFYKKVIGQ